MPSIGEVFPSDERVSRLVMRLSMALGDLRIAPKYATRDKQTPYERLYFVRLMAMHLRELLPVVDPPNESTLPNVNALLRDLRPSREDAKALRNAHERLLRQLHQPFESRRVTLRRELKRLRNGFAHYHAKPWSDKALTDAMEMASGTECRYRIAGGLRAEYADEVAHKVVHPFSDDVARELHERIAAVIEQLAEYLQLVEAVYLARRYNHTAG
jgi:hypothetical protein